MMFRVRPVEEALAVWLNGLAGVIPEETVRTAEALGRVTAGRLVAGWSLPAFPRSTMDGFAVRSADTFGATEALPAYLELVGEVLMARESGLEIGSGQAAIIHTGGMVPPGADAVVMLEQTQGCDAATIEVLRAVAPGENLVDVGEDVSQGDVLFEAGHLLRPQDIGGLMALGITHVGVACRPRVAIISTGDELVSPDMTPGLGQVRDVNTYTLAGLTTKAGGRPLPRKIVADDQDALLLAARTSLEGADVLAISAGSSVSARDLTAGVIEQLGLPGVLVHGVAIRPGKPTILGLCKGKPVLGLPGNPVSALVAAELFLAPLLARLMGMTPRPMPPATTAVLARNLASAAGREDFVPVKLEERDGRLWAEPVLGKSNLIYTLVKADGKIRIPLDSTGLYQGELVGVELF